ncbi:MAG TPA: cyclic pyranopterin monophosphate synthase MoaC [Candidatus Ozemobacteraceae bacterium]|nr:cyclic pyranopterin monophosphate synthase MoaC [Candidatus Ozemobacteraceae bacterium]
MADSLTHLDSEGRVKMVDVGGKAVTKRRAVAFGTVRVGEKALSLLREGLIAKGDAWAATRVAAIMAAKRTSDLIPLTHPIRLDAVNITLAPFGAERVAVIAEALASDRTGVEMEAMTAVSVAQLNLYDMIKGVTKGVSIEGTRLLLKTGGKSGDWIGEGVETGRIEKLATSRAKGIPKDPTDEVMIKPGFGVEGDAHGGDWHRQISLLGLESIRKMQEKGLNVDFGSFAENIATSGIMLYELPVGTLLWLSGTVLLEVTQIGKECHTKCAVYHKAGDCVMPREGIFARVLTGGPLHSGNELLAIKIEHKS